MSDYNSQLSLSVFTFGVLRRRFIVAIILEGLALLGYLQFESNGSIKLGFTSRYLPALAVIGLAAAILTFYFSRSIARSSYSPVLHRGYVPYFIATGYLLLGLSITAAAFLAHSLLLGQSPVPQPREIAFGLSLGPIFGFLILIYIDRYEIQTPQNRNELEDTITSIQEQHNHILESEKAPIQLTESFESLEKSMVQAADYLKESHTEKGWELAHQIEDWVDTFQEKPEVSQAAIVVPTRSREEKELSEMHEEFKSITDRLQRVSNDE